MPLPGVDEELVRTRLDEVGRPFRIAEVSWPT
jgi:hypothetical protein